MLQNVLCYRNLAQLTTLFCNFIYIIIKLYVYTVILKYACAYTLKLNTNDNMYILKY